VDLTNRVTGGQVDVPPVTTVVNGRARYVIFFRGIQIYATLLGVLSNTSFGRMPVSSSNLRSIGYDPWASTLEVEFQSGSIYQHYAVPYSVYHGLMNASSKGRYYCHNLRNRNGCTRVY
jgi:hypothetical protein